jgi:hypothetical protein
MIDGLPGALAELPADAVACVTTTWALAYLPPAGRDRFAAQLGAAARARPIVWISGEGPGIVPAFADCRPPPELDDIEPSLLGAIRYDGDTADATMLAFVHPHGASIDWVA